MSVEEILEAYYEYRQSQEGEGNVPPKGALSQNQAIAVLTELIQEAEANGRRIQAEATLDKFNSVPANDEWSRAFPNFLKAQVEAWQHAATLQESGEPKQ